MLPFVVFLLILDLVGVSNGAAIDSASEHVSIKLAIPRGQTEKEYLQSIVDYWTPERMASAKPMDLLTVNNNAMPSFNNHQKNNGVKKILAPSALPTSTRNLSPSTAGKVYFTMNGGNYLCSGSVVNAPNRDFVVTAGHCMFDYETQSWATRWAFVPQYSQGSRPLGTFAGRQIVTLNGWASNQDYNYDVGIVLVNPNEHGEHIQDVTGGLSLAINPSHEMTHSFGYPVNMQSGETVSNCIGTSFTPVEYSSFFSGRGLRCDMTGGASGGPWIQGYDANTHLGQQCSVNSFIITNNPGYIYGPTFTENNIGVLYDEYKDQ